jgi:predicted metal-binding membrane protein
MLRQERWIVIGSLAGVTILAWVYVLSGAAMGMSVSAMTTTSLFPHTMTGMETMPGIGAMSTTWSLGYTALMGAMWWVMMIAMMTPSAAPTILLYARVHRHAQNRGQIAETLVPTGAFAFGYLAAWAAFAVTATALQWALETLGQLSAGMMWSQSKYFSAAILLSAGAYQFTPAKDACLRQCRSPAQFIADHFSENPMGAVRMGAIHGAYCIGCCWALMALLFVGGVMNILWIALLALFVFAEKLSPPGPLAGRILGGALVVWGVVTLF